jgi:hypothetical protein
MSWGFRAAKTPGSKMAWRLFLGRRKSAWMRMLEAGTEAGCFHSMSFCAAKTQKLKNGTEAVF